MRTLLLTAALLFACAAPASAHEGPPPKGNDTGCCFSFDNSPVNLVFCTTKDACRIEPPK